MIDQSELSDAIFALGMLRAEQPLCNRTLLCRAASIAAEAIPAAGVGLAVFSGDLGEGEPLASCAARRSTTEPEAPADAQAFLQLAGSGSSCLFEGPGWQNDEEGKALAQSLAAMPGEELHEWTGGGRLWTSIVDGQAGATFCGVFEHEKLNHRLVVVIAGVADDASAGRARAIMPYLLDSWKRGWTHEPEWMTNLKPASRVVLELVLQGLDDDQIADISGLTYHSVRAHLKRLFKSAGVRSRLHLMQECRQNNFLPAEVDESLAEAV